ncbi:hypothetical protein IFM89_035175 [Coptis chinensis]|uniref:Uncharacterized protein n=1 Tax=Coptis chinensis TaxID=261450 RepID=A0A835MBJ9_9MAGN|nr:hypothetical protein IFM89_035175 [Coptis chinensis]
MGKFSLNRRLRTLQALEITEGSLPEKYLGVPLSCGKLCENVECSDVVIMNRGLCGEIKKFARLKRPEKRELKRKAGPSEVRPGKQARTEGGRPVQGVEQTGGRPRSSHRSRAVPDVLLKI